MNFVEYCDNIFEKAKDEFLRMEKSSVIWDVPQYSKTQITKAGRVLAEGGHTKSEEDTALQILNNWRSSHAYPLQVIANNLRRNNPNAIVVQRLKRLDSILNKLKRFPSMDLYRMQDLGGCRVIVDDVEKVYDTIKRYKDSRVRHIFKREYDYIKQPKESGYRCYHLVYQFHSDDSEIYNKNMLIEIQVRTKLQHTWATAVEMMGIYTKTALKSSIGDGDTLRFFILVSSIFAKIEGTSLVPNTSSSYEDIIAEICDIDKKLNIVSKLSALTVAIQHVDEKNLPKKKGYYILILNYEKRMLRVQYFPPSKVEEATMVYNMIESNRNKNIDAVLVLANSFDSLKSAYPNYFVDIGEFIDLLRSIIDG